MRRGRWSEGRLIIFPRERGFEAFVSGGGFCALGTEREGNVVRAIGSAVWECGEWCGVVLCCRASDLGSRLGMRLARGCDADALSLVKAYVVSTGCAQVGISLWGCQSDIA